MFNMCCDSLTGIFEKHKLLFSFQITIKLEQDQNLVTQEQVDFFIKVCVPYYCSDYFNLDILIFKEKSF